MNDNVYEKIVKLTRQTCENFKSRGIAVPVADEQGNIRVGKFTIIRKNDGQYQIKDQIGQIVYNNINLPQTAILVANSLATNQRVDNKVLKSDLVYGTKMFDDANYSRLSKIYLKRRQISQSLNMSIQSDYAADQAMRARDTVIKTYEKLFRLR